MKDYIVKWFTLIANKNILSILATYSILNLNWQSIYIFPAF